MKRTTDRLLSISAAARELGVSESTLRWHTKRGHLPYIADSGGRRMFWDSDMPAVREALDATRRRRPVATSRLTGGTALP